MQAIQPILTAYAEGHSVMLLHGRSLYDLDVDVSSPDRPDILTIEEGLRRQLRCLHGIASLSWNLAGGLDAGQYRMDDGRDAAQIDAILKTHGLVDIPQDEHELRHYIRGFTSLLKAPTEGLTWANGDDLRFALVVDFAEHSMPSMSSGTQTMDQMIASEGVHLLAHSLALRKRRNLLLLHGRLGQIDDLITRSVHQVRLPQPGFAEKKCFIETLRRFYSGAQLDEGLSWDQAANITSATPNSGLEAQCRASALTALPITAAALVKAKNLVVQELSEGTLTILDTSGIEGVELVGQNIEVPARILDQYADRLAVGDPNMPANFLLCGAPSTAKTDLARRTARRAGVAAFTLHPALSPWVGESQRLTRVQAQTLRDSRPNLSFSDEASESLPLGRDRMDTDSGATRSVIAVLLSEFSDETRRGANIWIGATNRIFDISTAFLSRCEIVPVLAPLRRDFPAIILNLARRVARNPELEIDAACLDEAAELFYSKSANPRTLRAALERVTLRHSTMSEDAVGEAARNFAPSGGVASAIFAELWAIKLASDMSYLPWCVGPAEYPYPAHLQGIVDTKTGSIDYEALDDAIEAYRPHAHV